MDPAGVEYERTSESLINPMEPMHKTARSPLNQLLELLNSGLLEADALSGSAVIVESW